MASLAPSLSLSLSSRCAKHQHLVLCQASSPEKLDCADKSYPAAKLQQHLNRRHVLLSAASAPAVISSFNHAAFALIEADDDEELLEKVKEDRKKKIKRREEMNMYKEETASIQAAIYQLSKAGQALDGNDFVGARKALGDSPSDGWIANLEQALSKVSSNAEEQDEARLFSSSLASLQKAVSKQDLNLSKSEFVRSAGALEKWSFLTGLSDQLKGL